MDYYTKALKNYSVFTGRATRTEFWMFVLINILISIAVSVVGRLIKDGGILATIYSLALLIPSLALNVRRLHDTNRSGWWLLISFLPLIGLIVLIVFYATDSTPGANQYGPNPKGPVSA